MEVNPGSLKEKFQLRVIREDSETLTSYTEAMIESGWGNFPPVSLAEIDGAYFIVDGHHRVKAAINAELESIPAEVVADSECAALVEAFRRNTIHGLRFSSADRSNAIQMILKAFWNLSDVQLAKKLGVSAPTIGRYRKKLQPATSTNEEDEKRIGADGKLRRIPQKKEVPAESTEQHDRESLAGEGAEDLNEPVEQPAVATSAEGEPFNPPPVPGKDNTESVPMTNRDMSRKAIELFGLMDQDYKIATLTRLNSQYGYLLQD